MVSSRGIKEVMNVDIKQHPEAALGGKYLRCLTASYAAVRSTTCRTATAVSLASKWSSMSCVGRVIWSRLIVLYGSQLVREVAGDQWWGWLVRPWIMHPFKQLECNAQQWDGPSSRVVLGHVRLREDDDSCLAPDSGEFISFQTGRHIILTQPLGCSISCI